MSVSFDRSRRLWLKTGGLFCIGLPLLEYTHGKAWAQANPGSKFPPASGATKAPAKAIKKVAKAAKKATGKAVKKPAKKVVKKTAKKAVKKA